MGDFYYFMYTFCMKENNLEKIDPVKTYLQDYTNEIMACYQLFQRNGIEAVKDQFKGGFYVIFLVAVYG